MLQRRHDQKNNLFTVTKLQWAMITTPSDKQDRT